MFNETLIEIPIYSCKQDALLKRITFYVDNQMATVPDYGNGFWQQQRDQELERQIWPVRFNALVGYIDVHSLESQLRADWWFLDKERIHDTRRNRGVIRWVGKLLECSYLQGATSMEIFTDFRNRLQNAVGHHSRLQARFVDYNAFDRVGPHIDWSSILRLKQDY